METRLVGVVERVTFHNVENGWSVLKVSPFDEPHALRTVVIHQAKVFAGSSMEFWGSWIHHAKHGEQFKAERAIEKKPSTSAALEKYLGSGLIRGVGPKTAKKIVQFFKDKTLEVFEERIDDLLKVPGIAEKKLSDVKDSWQEHKSIRDVMLFLQEYGISTLFAVKIYKQYGPKAIEVVSRNPYQLAKDIYGIGFFSADKIALSMGFERDGDARIEAGIKHVLAASREEGHCFLTLEQITEKTHELLELNCPDRLVALLSALLSKNEIKNREQRYYSNSLYYDELCVADIVKRFLKQKIAVDDERVNRWVGQYCEKQAIQLSDEQMKSIMTIVGKSFSILTGGPGCGKTTTTRVLVKLLLAMKKQIILAAPTGRAAQRMSEVMGLEAKTIHRLLELEPKRGGFKKNEHSRLNVDFLIIDESSMLDISLAAALLKALPDHAQILLIGDPDQLPSVGAGNVLSDLLASEAVPRCRLTQVFRQAQESLIVRYAHEINQGEVPKIDTPLKDPSLWRKQTTCLFVDAEEATLEQLKFISRVKSMIGAAPLGKSEAGEGFIIPDKFKHVDLEKLVLTQGVIEELKAVLKTIHPYSSLHEGMTAVDVVLRLYAQTIKKHFGERTEIQILTPQIRGSLGTMNLNLSIQSEINPERQGCRQIKLGERIYREGDRVIQTRNNYDKGVYNGDIGRIVNINLETYQCLVQFSTEPVLYEREDLSEINLAYAITIHKSQGSEFDVVIIPVATQHFKMLFRNLIYTGLTRAKKLCVFVGSRKALAMAVSQVDQRQRQTALTELLM